MPLKWLLLGLQPCRIRRLFSCQNVYQQGLWPGFDQGLVLGQGFNSYRMQIFVL